MKELIEKQTGLKLKKTTYKFPEVGKTYYIDYWKKCYECIGTKESDIWGTLYVCKWEDGSVSSHCTRLEKYDFEVIKGEM